MLFSYVSRTTVIHVSQDLHFFTSGGGKSVLLKLLLMLALKKGAVVCIADFKGGVDFPPIWHKQCRMCIEEESSLALLTELVDELQRRKTLLAASGQPNIDRYNDATGESLPRYIFARDEIAEVLDKTGLTKEQKEIVGKIESKLSMIARQGHATAAFTLDVYGHVTNQMQEASAVRMEAYIKGILEL